MLLVLDNFEHVLPAGFILVQQWRVGDALLNMVGQPPSTFEMVQQRSRASPVARRTQSVSAREAAELLGVCERTIRRAIARGALLAIKQGRAFQITPEALASYPSRRGNSPRDEPLAPAAQAARPGPPALASLQRDGLARRAALPLPLTRFIGREREVVAIADLLRLDDVRIVTLTGTGGVGKTRLALRVAEVVANEFADDVAFVPLAGVDRPHLVLPAIARALEVREAPGRPLRAILAGALADRRPLLLLDNFEHLLPAAVDLAGLLADCPGLTVLTTSRERLRISGEWRIVTGPLALPTAGETPSLDRLSTFDAIALFVERARQVRRGFALDAGNAEAVTEVCLRLDGLPLALELAAARLSLLAPRELLARLDQRLPLLTGGATDQPPRLRAMHDAIAWSHDFLAADERRLFRQLAVFTRGFTLDAAEVVGREGGDVASSSTPSVLDLLTRLVDKSLVQLTRPDAPDQRFAMLETVREFALDQLAASGEEFATRAAHAEHFVALAEAAAGDAGRAGDLGWMRRLQAERSNLQAALNWLDRTGRGAEVLQMCGALWHYWYRLGDLVEGRARLERALAAVPDDVDPAIRARALHGAGVLAWQSADYVISRERLEAALTAYRARGDRAGAAWVLNSLGCLRATLSDMEQAEASMTEALTTFREIGDAVGVANLTSNLGELAEAAGNHQLAASRLEEGLAMWHAVGDRVGALRAMVYLAQALLACGELARAEAVLQKALAAVRDADYKQILPAALRIAGQLAMRRGDPVTAARWYGAADGVMIGLGMELPAARRAGHERLVGNVRERLGTTAFIANWAAGRDLTPEQAVADILSYGLGAAGGGEHATPGTSWLSPRERDVLRQLVAGRSDNQIAEALFITRRTASKHVSAILAKLEVDSRTAAVATALRLGLD